VKYTVYTLGEVIKKIRQSKKYTQKYVSDEEMSRTTYAKIEAGKMQPTVGKFFHILERLDISYNEFRFIQNKYHLSGKEEIIHDFFNLSSNIESELLESLLKKCDDFLEEHADNIVQDIDSACRAQILISKQNDYEGAYNYADKIWDRLSKLDNWYSTELKLINNIFFIFPLETGISIAERALKELERFSYINVNNNLKPAYLLNMTLLLVNNKDYSKAIYYADKVINDHNSSKNYQFISLAYARKGIALINLKKKTLGIDAAKKAVKICNALDQFRMSEEIKKEVKYKTNVDIDF
jgi:transcriptional activator, Rgg/GadR/MutR family, C-terminal domain